MMSVMKCRVCVWCVSILVAHLRMWWPRQSQLKACSSILCTAIKKPLQRDGLMFVLPSPNSSRTVCVQEILDGIKIKNNGMYFINILQPPLTIQSSYILVVEIPIQDTGLPQENKKKT